ncbi:MAG: hypothetical protein JKY96_02335 [Phycisphaerales bacterium]|nr:hypothetical protein [Phycisphaerales bacterium]
MDTVPVNLLNISKHQAMTPSQSLESTLKELRAYGVDSNRDDCAYVLGNICDTLNYYSFTKDTGCLQKLIASLVSSWGSGEYSEELVQADLLYLDHITLRLADLDEVVD